MDARTLSGLRPDLLAAMVRHECKRLGWRYRSNHYRAIGVGKDYSAFWRTPGKHHHVYDTEPCDLGQRHVYLDAGLPALVAKLIAIPTPGAVPLADAAD